MDEDRHSIFVHSVPAKDGVVPLGPYFCPYAIPSLETRWCDLHNAMMQTLLHAYHHDPDAKQFIFVSTTSIPLVSFDELYDSLIADGDKSRICFTHPNAAQRIFKEYHVELGLELNQTGKAEMWFDLSRRHVEILLRSRDSMDYWNTKFQFHGIGCPDETMIPTALLHRIDALSELKQCTPVGPDSLNTCCTHAVFWRETAIAYHGADLKKTSTARNHSLLRSLVSDDCENAPCNIRKVIKEEGLEALRKSGYLMFRKVHPEAKFSTKDKQLLPLSDGVLQFTEGRPVAPVQAENALDAAFVCKAPVTLKKFPQQTLE